MNEGMISEIAQAIAGRSGRALLVGGCVRDRILGLPCCDVDCEVHGVGAEALKALLSSFGELDLSGEDYGIYTLKGAGLDFALPRTERRSGPGHKDFEVKTDPSLSAAEAAVRRDFTVNAIMQDALTGEYVDPFGGMEDLRRGVLRAVPGSRFEDDPLRVLRGAQFSARFGLEPEEGTIAKMRRMPLSSLSAARVMSETRKALLLAERPSVYFDVLKKADALHPWFEELAALIGVKQDAAYHPEGDAWTHTLMTLDEAAKRRETASDPLAFMLAALTHDLGKAVSTYQDENGTWNAEGHEETGLPLAERMLGRLQLPGAAVKYVLDLCSMHTRAHVAYYTQAEEEAVNLLLDESVCARDLCLLVVCDVCGTGVDQQKKDRETAFMMDRLYAYERAVLRAPDAKLLLSLGAQPGKALGEAIKAARRYALAGDDPKTAAKKALGRE